MKDIQSVLIETRHLIERSREYREQLRVNGSKLREAVEMTWQIIGDIRNRRESK